MTKQPTDAPPPLRERIVAGARAAGRRGRHELTRDGGLGNQAHGLFRRWMRKIWHARGGGLYAVGFAVTFLWLETVDIVFEDIPLAATIDWLSSDVFAFVVQFVVDTLINTLYAFIWPAFVIGWNSPWGIILLIAAFLLFPRFVKAPLEHWLFDGEPPPGPEPKKTRSGDGIE